MLICFKFGKEFHFLMKIIIFALIPLILSIGISIYLPSIDAQIFPQLVTDNPKYFEPNGYGLAILEYNEWPTTPYDYLKGNLFVMSPLAQLNIGILPFDIQCKSGLELVVKSSKESVGCVTPNSVAKLIERNWMHVFEPAVALAAAEVASSEEPELETEETSSETIQKQSYPSDGQRAMTYVVTFSGASLTPEESEPLYTFAKFQHVSKITDRTIVLSEDSSDRPQFVLEALPSLDKKVYYRMLADWINGHPNARTFDVKIDIVAGNGETIQSWIYTDCNWIDYHTYLLENLVVFSFHQKFESEIREQASYECAGFAVEVPE